MKVDNYVLLREGNNKSPEAVQVESEFVQTHLTVHRLRDIVICGHMRSAPPVHYAEKLAFDALYDLKIEKPRQMLSTLQGQGNTWDRTEKPEIAPKFEEGLGNERFEEDTNAAVVVHVQDDYQRTVVRSELRDLQDTIARLIGEVHKLLLTFIIATISHHIDELDGVVAADAHAASTEGAWPQTAGRSGHANTTQPRKNSKDSLPSGLTATTFAVASTCRSEAVAAFNRVRARGSRTRTQGPLSEVPAYVIREHDLDECFEELGRRLLQWARGTLATQTLQAKHRIDDGAQRMLRFERESLETSYDSIKRVAALEDQVTAVVADQSHKQLRDMDRLHRTMNELATASLEMEHRLGSEIKTNVLHDLHVLETQLQDVQARFSQYLGGMRSAVNQQVQALRESLLEQLSGSSTALFMFKQKIKEAEEESLAEQQATSLPSGGGATAGAVVGSAASTVPITRSQAGNASGNATSALTMAASGTGVVTASTETGEPSFEKRSGIWNSNNLASAACLPPEGSQEIEALHIEISELAKASSGLEALYRAKFQLSRQNFEHKLQIFKTALSSNADLWDHASEVREREKAVEGELAHSRRRLEAASRTVQQLVAHAANEDMRVERLEGWKTQAFERFDKLLKEERKYERVDSYDVDKLCHDLNSLDEEIFRLSRRDTGARISERIEAESHRSKVQRKALSRQIAQEKKLADKANTKADLIRREIECGDVVDDESLVALLADEYRHLIGRIRDLEAENATLTATMPTRGSQRIAKRGALKTALPKANIQSLQTQMSRTTDFEERLCFSVETRAIVRPTVFRSQIDSARDVGLSLFGQSANERSESAHSARESRRNSSLPKTTSEPPPRHHLLAEIASDLVGRGSEPGGRPVVARQPSASDPGQATTELSIGERPEYYVARIAGDR
eukprot:TRINITY_DN42940_c0_g1_i1.p1 TRINITY_DN42940_c0_g1~~TRINITY_DN42940_c0_g1_i1.p1  ORF type:complete len:971 (+),score=167.66 TRINITY_DN42940_c0_g1_i1:167-2914(+)